MRKKFPLYASKHNKNKINIITKLTGYPSALICLICFSKKDILLLYRDIKITVIFLLNVIKIVQVRWTWLPVLIVYKKNISVNLYELINALIDNV